MQKGRLCVMGALEIIANIVDTSSASLSEWKHHNIELFANCSCWSYHKLVN